MYDQRLISIRRGLPRRAHRCTLAHELAHAIRADEPVASDFFTARIERAADEMAASWLITKADYVAVEQLFPGDMAAMCRELDVTQHVLRVWQRAALK